MCQAEIGKMFRGKRNFPPVGIESASFGPDRPKDRPWTLLSGLRVYEGRMYLNYGVVEEEIPTITMREVPITVNGIKMPTLPTETLLWRYRVRSGVIKPKDVPKLQKLQEYNNTHPDELSDPVDYEPYARFLERIESKYPGRLAVDRAFWNLDAKLNGLFSGSLMLYGLIGLFRKN